jgi:hypothetical protein
LIMPGKGERPASNGRPLLLHRVPAPVDHCINFR